MKAETCSGVETVAGLERTSARSFFMQAVKTGGILGVEGEVFGKLSNIT